MSDMKKTPCGVFLYFIAEISQIISLYFDDILQKIDDILLYLS